MQYNATMAQRYKYAKMQRCKECKGTKAQRYKGATQHFVMAWCLTMAWCFLMAQHNLMVHVLCNSMALYVCT